MSRQAWLRRLRDQLPGWNFRTVGIPGWSDGRTWYATNLAGTRTIGPLRTPQELRSACRSAARNPKVRTTQ